MYDYGARFYDPSISLWASVDPLTGEMPDQGAYNYTFQNPIMFNDPTGMKGEGVDGVDDWVERTDAKGNKSIVWDSKVTSATDKDLQAGDVYLGKNVLVGTHNRDATGNEKINSATFDLYLASNTTGPTATIKGNTVPANIKKYGTLPEGLYSASLYKYNGDDAILIGGGGNLPTVSGNPNNPKNYDAAGNLKPTSTHVMDQILFHKGNYARPSLSTSSGKAISKGCQTGGCGPGTLPIYRAFMRKAVTAGSIDSYYLRPK